MNTINESERSILESERGDISRRKSTQYLMPVKLETYSTEEEDYNIYPFCPLGDNKIFNGYAGLAQYIMEQREVLIDGYAGIFWDDVVTGLTDFFRNAGLTINISKTSDFFKSADEIEKLVKPFLGADDSVWGSKCTFELSNLYNQELLEIQPKPGYDINIVIGCGAALVNWDAPVIYVDLPKNELQFRMRAGSITNLGCESPSEPTSMYKRFYFVDWVLLNNHKKSILERIKVIADGQWGDDINWMYKEALVEGLSKISQSVIRVRPWFEPGAWGGQWIKDRINNLNKDVINYAWSFELIVPENGLVFESEGYLLEVSFDFLMFSNQAKVLGKHAPVFGDEFPIRFDFLDTFDGGNLSIQVHPRLKYIQEVFGENITQDETYYILDCKEDAKVYLGFQENIDAAEFRSALETSQAQSKEVQIEEFVQCHPAKKHDLFLIPNGTVHSSGKDNLVLEISATPYIFTFKMYDWLRLDLEGKPRPINIAHAFNNLDFERKGDRVQQELISKQYVLEEGADWQIVHLPTHADHFYDVHRLEFAGSMAVNTDNCCHVMMLVEGSSVMVKTSDGSSQVFAYAETFVIPAATSNYELINMGEGKAKVIKAFLK
ncbi:class I mannose-6-phosphate isomerase [Desertivirga brevis]|uniref:class I mannose-6-phosphate isomerase n=1 Tax=Desertivirga brevis TaxID=2810310 RepID=UPI001F6115BB|nr:class I mannose-6-phosphate isomerase [Pedobacter sp. SYSU D00873]